MTTRSITCNTDHCISLSGKLTIRCDNCDEKDGLHYWHVITKRHPIRSQDFCQKCVESFGFTGMCDLCHTYIENETRIFENHHIHKSFCYHCVRFVPLERPQKEKIYLNPKSLEC
jgi:hypothetical protein